MTNLTGGVAGLRLTCKRKLTANCMNPLTKISTLMATDLVVVMSSTSLADAKALFDKHNIHHLPVVTPEGQIEGMLSTSDFYRLADQDANPSTVGEIMTRGLAKLESYETVRTAANVFALNRFHALPVVENDKLVGMLTTLDLIKLLDNEKIDLADYKNP
jgi:acetoin utilization protein AcuB